VPPGSEAFPVEQLVETSDINVFSTQRVNRTTLSHLHGRGLHSLPRHPIVRGVVDYVEENYAASISLRHVARALGYSPAHLTHTFSLLTGTPVTAWIIKRRLFAAQMLLVETRQDVISVCEAVGFGDLCYFTRQFVRHVGVTPTQFRSANKSKVEHSKRP
jgi:AraC-like DNA-binding protein